MHLEMVVKDGKKRRDNGLPVLHCRHLEDKVEETTFWSGCSTRCFKSVHVFKDTSSCLHWHVFTYTHAGPRYVVQIGDKVIDYNEDFRLFLATRNPSPFIPPDAVSVVTEVNFTTTRAGLRGQVDYTIYYSSTAQGIFVEMCCRFNVFFCSWLFDSIQFVSKRHLRRNFVVA